MAGMISTLLSRSGHVGKQGLLGEGNFRVLAFLAGVVSSIVISESMAEKILKWNGDEVFEVPQVRVVVNQC